MDNIIKTIANSIRNTEFADNTFVVGGFVRDKIMGNTSEDLDIVVTLPQGGIKLAQFLFNTHICSRPVIFNKFGTAQVTIQDHKIEFVMARSEKYQEKSRKPEVLPGTINEDIIRRDFTINSLIMDIMNGKILDMSQRSISDIQNKIIRATANPETIFQDDPLRMLRAVRFAVQLNFTIETVTFTKIIENSQLLENISKERIRDEFSKILLSQNPATGIRLLKETRLLNFIIPDLKELDGTEQDKYHDKDMLEHTLQVLQNTPADLVIRLAALLHDIAKPYTKTETKKEIHFYYHEAAGAKRARKILRKLKYPNYIIYKVAILIKNHMRLKSFGNKLTNFSDSAVRRLILQLDTELDQLLILINADNVSRATKYCLQEQIPNLKKRISSNLKKIKGKSLPITGNDIILHFKVKEGKEIGIILDQARQIWIDHPSWNKNKILNAIKRGGTMTEKKVSKIVHDAVIKAAHAGEDVIKAVGNVTKEIIATVKKEDLDNKEKAQKLAKEALEGAKEGFEKVKPPTEEFVKKASITISDSFKEHAPKVASFVKEVFSGIVEGTKDVIDEHKKTSVKPEEKPEKSEVKEKKEE
ncbi:MAG: CCA tRNA nucleotidyltransferase [Candidatus Cloacimonetes bacterium]|nr:CCA tRNA nucleotidyltransferase [Candidatus Cloacimonadota bacterium]